MLAMINGINPSAWTSPQSTTIDPLSRTVFHSTRKPNRREALPLLLSYYVKTGDSAAPGAPKSHAWAARITPEQRGKASTAAASAASRSRTDIAGAPHTQLRRDVQRRTDNF